MVRRHVCFWVLILTLHLCFMGCNSSSSDTTAATASTESTATDDTSTSVSNEASAPTDEEISDALTALSSILTAIPWEEVGEELENVSQSGATVQSSAIEFPEWEIYSTNGMTNYITIVQNSEGAYVIQLRCVLDGFAVADTLALTDASLSGTMYIQIYFENIFTGALGMDIFTEDGSPLALSGKTLLIIPTTITLGITEFYAGYNIWTLGFTDDPSPYGTIVINGALPITMSSEWTTFFLNLLGL